MDSSNVSEDGASERVRFDSTVCYVLDNNKKEYLDTVSKTLNRILNRGFTFIDVLINIGYKQCG